MLIYALYQSRGEHGDDDTQTVYLVFFLLLLVSRVTDRTNQTIYIYIYLCRCGAVAAGKTQATDVSRVEYLLNNIVVSSSRLARPRTATGFKLPSQFSDTIISTDRASKHIRYVCVCVMVCHTIIYTIVWVFQTNRPQHVRIDILRVAYRNHTTIIRAPRMYIIHHTPT